MQPPRVLYVDDDEDSREMLRMLLESHSIETKAVGTAREALSSIQAEHFDLYLLDGWLPDLDGFELCRQMRCCDSNTPILFYSGSGCEADKTMGREAGANAYVIKPNISDLLESIAQFLRGAKSAAVLEAGWGSDSQLSVALLEREN